MYSSSRTDNNTVCHTDTGEIARLVFIALVQSKITPD